MLLLSVKKVSGAWMKRDNVKEIDTFRLRQATEELENCLSFKSSLDSDIANLKKFIKSSKYTLNHIKSGNGIPVLDEYQKVKKALKSAQSTLDSKIYTLSKVKESIENLTKTIEKLKNIKYGKVIELGRRRRDAKKR